MAQTHVDGVDKHGVRNRPAGSGPWHLCWACVLATAVLGCDVPVGSTDLGAGDTGIPATSPDGDDVASVVEDPGAMRHIVAQPGGTDNLLEWVFNVFGAPSDERTAHTFRWDFGDGASDEGDIVSHIYGQPGIYVVSVDVTDAAGASAYLLTEFVAVNVSAIAPPPFAVLFDGELDRAGTPVILHATAHTSLLAADETVTYVWTFADGTSAEGTPITHPLNLPGPYRVDVAARTSLGRTATYFRYFTATGGEVNPGGNSGDEDGLTAATGVVARAGADQTVAADATVTLNGSGSTVPVGQTAAYGWTQVSGPSVVLGTPSHMRTSFVAPRPDDAPLVLVFELTVTAGHVSATDRVSITVATGSPASDQPVFGMEVLSVETRTDSVTITTTGGVYEIGPQSLAAARRIAPASNTVAPRPVARLEFDAPLGTLTVQTSTAFSCVVRASGGAEFDVRGDSLVFVNAVGAAVGYTYHSLLPSPPWAKGTAGDFYWNDGDGGSTHYMHPDRRGTYQGTSDAVPDQFRIALAAGQSAAFGVFPTRPFDFEKLYGAEARPFICCLYNYGLMDTGAGLRERADWYASHGFGVFLLRDTLYLNDPDGSNPMIDDPQPDDRYRPVYNRVTRRWEYLYTDPQRIHDFVAFAHAHGFKVITYFGAYEVDQYTGVPVSTSLAWMRDFRAEFELDGWYVDGLTCDTNRNWPEAYDFIRQLRTDVGENGYLFFHDSYDPWGWWDGRVLVHAETYCNANLKGENGAFATLHSPHDAFHRYYNGAYGSSQVISMQISKFDGTPRGSITIDERHRTIANLCGGAWVASLATDEFEDSFWPPYAENRIRYSQGTLLASLPTALDWFIDISVSVSDLTATAARVSWSTAEPTVAQLRYIAEQPQYGYAFDPQVWVEPSGYTTVPFISQDIATAATSHSVVLNGLSPGTTYYVRARSSTAASSPGSVYNPSADRIYGGFTSFQTPVPTP